MFRNALKMAWRNLRQQPGYSLINLLGLALGLATCTLIMLWVRHEQSVDTFHPQMDRFYRVMQYQRYDDGRVYTFSATPGALKEDLMENFPEVELAARYGWEEQRLLQNEAREGFYFSGRNVDAEFLSLIGIPVLHGSIEKALKTPTSMVITESTATSMFGDARDAVGKTVYENEERSYTIAAVLADLPDETNFSFDYLTNWHYVEQEYDWFLKWGNNAPSTFLRLRENADVSAFEARLGGRVGEFMEETVTELFLHPVEAMHLYSRWDEGVLVGGRIENVRIFTLVAIFILLIAAINFMNLATARSARRGKEVGLRKVIGAQRSQLIGQFMGESLLMTFLAGGLAAGLVLLLLPYFNTLTGKALGNQAWAWQTLVWFVAILVITAILAGSYPALYLSKFIPAKVLKGQQNRGRGAASFRRVLVVVQFSLSILLLIGTVVIFKQLQYLQSADPGYEREQLVSIPIQGNIMGHYPTIREELMATTSIINVGTTDSPPINIGRSTGSVTWEGKDPDDHILFTTLGIDFALPEMFGMKLLAGRFHNAALSTDSLGFIINEKAASAMGYSPEEAINQPLTVWGGHEGAIIGVVQDFHFQSLHNAIDPAILIPQADCNYLFARIAPGQTTKALAALESMYDEYASAYPFEYNFLDEEWASQYAQEQMVSGVARYFAGLAIIISLLGLFGLAAFTAEQRTKEIGVRKVLGASVPQLASLMSRDFLLLVGIAALLGCGLAYWLMSDWLREFAYHISLGWGIFFLATLTTLGIALLTVGVHAIRSATSNPIKALRHE